MNLLRFRILAHHLESLELNGSSCQFKNTYIYSACQILGQTCGSRLGTCSFQLLDVEEMQKLPYQAPSKELGHENADNESKKMEAAAEEKKVRSSKVLSHTASYKQLHMRKMARRPKSRKQRLGRRVFIFVWERADFIVHLWHEQK